MSVAYFKGQPDGWYFTFRSHEYGPFTTAEDADKAHDILEESYRNQGACRNCNE